MESIQSETIFQNLLKNFKLDPKKGIIIILLVLIFIVAPIIISILYLSGVLNNEKDKSTEQFGLPMKYYSLPSIYDRRYLESIKRNDKNDFIVLMYSDNCGHCVNYFKQYDLWGNKDTNIQLSSNARLLLTEQARMINFAKIDVNNTKNSMFNEMVFAVPMIYYINHDKNNFTVFEGDRTQIDQIIEFYKSCISS